MEYNIKSYRTQSFKKLLDKLPSNIQEDAQKAFEAWKENHSNIGFKPLAITSNVVWSGQVNTRYRALAKKDTDENGTSTYHWFWIGSHEDYNNILKNLKNMQNKISSFKQSAPTPSSKSLKMN